VPKVVALVALGGDLLDAMKIDAASFCCLVGDIAVGANGLDGGVGMGDQTFVIIWEVSMDKSLQVSTEAVQLRAELD
jgi:hypothetical protein